MTIEWPVVVCAIGLAGLFIDWWIGQRPEHNQRLDILHEVWRMLPVDPEFDADERDEPDQ